MRLGRRLCAFKVVITPQQSRTQHASALTLGHLKHQQDNQRRQDLGHGAELITSAAGALRAGQGLLLSTDARQRHPPV